MKVSQCLRTCAAFCLLALVALAQNSNPWKPTEVPETAKHPVTDEYFGIKVVDNYRWLENWDDLAVNHWTDEQNARTLTYLTLMPMRQPISQRITNLISPLQTIYSSLQYRGGKLFALQTTPGHQHQVLVFLKAIDPPDSQDIFDPDENFANGSFAVNFYSPSSDGKYVAAAISRDESENSDAHIYETETGNRLPDVVPRVNYPTGGGSIAWKNDNSGFYYTRYPQGTERDTADINFYQQVYFHKLGTEAKEDTYVIGKEFPRIAETVLTMSDNGHWLLASVANGDGGEFEHFLMDPDGHWKQLTHFEDGVVLAKFGNDQSLYLLSRKGAPRGQILRMALAQPELAKAKVMVAQSTGAGENGRASITDFAISGDRILVNDIVGGPSRVRIFNDKGQMLSTLPLPPVCSVDEVVAEGGKMLFRVSTYLEPPAWYSYDAASGKATRTGMYETSPAKFADAEVVREFATSKDGTRIPLNIIKLKKAKLNGANPVLLTAYGGYNISMTPAFYGYKARLWLDQGGIFVEANLRGGGEYGEEWHNAGKLTHKQNVFDDFTASAQYLIAHKYTSPKHLAIRGASNGGLLMGAALTQHPELFRAVVSESGIYDMLRNELDPNGQFNIPEYGSVKNQEQFKALYAYSPYHHVKDKTAYPAIFMFTGANDNRVDSLQTRKMIARLQAANASDEPVFLRFSVSAGHGHGSALRDEIEENADIYAFLFDELGIQFSAGDEEAK